MNGPFQARRLVIVGNARLADQIVIEDLGADMRQPSVVRRRLKTVVELFRRHDRLKLQSTLCRIIARVGELRRVLLRLELDIATGGVCRGGRRPTAEERRIRLLLVPLRLGAVLA